MKTSKLRKFAWVFFALALGTTTVFSQGLKNGKNRFNNQNQVCLSQISDLSEVQKTQIQEMESIHQKEMTVLRNERRSTTDAIEKNEIRGSMLQNVKSHQTAVRNLLTDEQQKQYDLLHVKSNKSGNKNFGNQNGNGFKNYSKNNSGQQQFARGNGNGCTGNQAGIKQGNQSNKNQGAGGCKGKNKKGKGNGQGNGNRNNTSNS